VALPPGSWSLQGAPPVLELKAEVKGKALALKAPIHAADLTIDDAGVVLTLGIGIDQVKSGSFLLDTAVRAFLVSQGAHELLYVGSGPSDLEPAQVGGVATSGRVAVDLELELSTVTTTSDGIRLAVTGTAVFEDVEVPIPGIGRLTDLVLEVHALLDLRKVA